MNRVFAFIGWIACMSLFSGCGEKLQPITELQENVIQDSLSSLGRAGRALPKAKSANQSGLFIETAGIPISGDQTLDQMRGKLTGGVMSKNCTLTGRESPNGSQKLPLAPDTHYLLGGEKCPATASFDTRTLVEEESGSGSIVIQAKYTAKDTDFKLLNDIDSVDLSTVIGAQARAPIAEGSGFVTVDLNIEGSGTIHSQKHGDIKVTIKGNGINGDLRLDSTLTSLDMNNLSGELKIRFDYAEFTVELKAEYTLVPVSSDYTKNGVTITQLEFEKYFRELEIPRLK